jgi:hypothetical protein
MQGLNFIQIYHIWEGYLQKIPVEGNLVSRLVFFANTLPTMIFNYTEYYLEHWLNK